MNTTSDNKDAGQESGASSGRANDQYTGGEAESAAVQKEAPHPGGADNAAGTGNSDKGEGAKGSNTGKDLHLDEEHKDGMNR